MTILKSDPSKSIEKQDFDLKPKVIPLVIFFQETDPTNDVHEEFWNYFQHPNDSSLVDESKIKIVLSTDLDEVISYARKHFSVIIVKPNESLIKDWFKTKCPNMAKLEDGMVQFQELLTDGILYTSTGSLEVENYDQMKSENFIKALRFTLKD